MFKLALATSRIMTASNVMVQRPLKFSATCIAKDYYKVLGKRDGETISKTSI